MNWDSFVLPIIEWIAILLELLFINIIIRKRIMIIRKSILKNSKIRTYDYLFPIVITKTRKWRKGFPLMAFSFAGYLIVMKNESRLFAKGILEEETIDRQIFPGTLSLHPYRNSIVVQGEDRYRVRYYLSYYWGSTRKNNQEIVDTVNRGVKFRRILKKEN